jgi:hypothetical protein
MIGVAVGKPRKYFRRRRSRGVDSDAEQRFRRIVKARPRQRACRSYESGKVAMAINVRHKSVQRRAAIAISRIRR